MAGDPEGLEREGLCIHFRHTFGGPQKCYVCFLSMQTTLAVALNVLHCVAVKLKLTAELNLG